MIPFRWVGRLTERRRLRQACMSGSPGGPCGSCTGAGVPCTFGDSNASAKSPHKTEGSKLQATVVSKGGKKPNATTTLPAVSTPPSSIFAHQVPLQVYPVPHAFGHYDHRRLPHSYHGGPPTPTAFYTEFPYSYLPQIRSLDSSDSRGGHMGAGHAGAWGSDATGSYHHHHHHPAGAVTYH